MQSPEVERLLESVPSVRNLCRAIRGMHLEANLLGYLFHQAT